MGAGTKVYVALLVTGATAFLGPEAVPRPNRGFGSADLRRSIRVVADQWEWAERRLRSGHPLADDDETQVLAQERLVELRREAILRDVQSASVLLVSAGSVVFAAFGMRRGIRRRSGPSGTVEVAADQTVPISPDALGAAMAPLARSRKDAIARLQTGPAMQCASCGRASKWTVLGRVGRRIFVRAGETPDLLAEGWWFRGLPPDACAKCGSTDTVES